MVNSQSAKEEYKKASGKAAVPDVLEDLLRPLVCFKLGGQGYFLQRSITHKKKTLPHYWSTLSCQNPLTFSLHL